MKIRSGFVSNSSSSSFIITGHSIDELKEYIKLALHANNFLNKENDTIDEILTIEETDDINKEKHRYYNYYNYDYKNPDKEISFKQYKKENNITKKEPGVIIASTGDNSIPWPIQKALENLGQRIHWG